MKYLLIILLLLLIGCEEHRCDHSNCISRSDYNVAIENLAYTIDINPADKERNDEIMVRTAIIDGHEYLYFITTFYGGSGSEGAGGLTHKVNCRYCQSRVRPTITPVE